MSLFDYYRPHDNLRCATCGRPLINWQGKDGPNAMFVWQEGVAAPVEQIVDEEIQIEPAERAKVRLPRSFVIYCYDCPEHYPVEADCRAPDGVWNETRVRKR